MKMLKAFDASQHQKTAACKKYTASQFGTNFMAFMEALTIEKLVPSETTRSRSADGYVWTDQVNRGGISITTTKHPLVERGDAGDVIIKGPAHIIEVVDSIIKQYATYEGMRPEDVEVKIEYHDTLNPALWTKNGEEYELKPRVHKALLQAGEAFVEFLKVPKVEVLDITLTGSCANYNWTSSSDIDLHVVVDLTQAEKEYGSIIKEYFDAKKRVWNDLHDISIKGFPVEFYVQDENEKHYSTGVYSLKDGDWVIKPEHNEPDIDDSAVGEKAVEMMKLIDDVLDSNKASAVEKVMDKVKKLRKSGLEEAGEFSTGNLVFKVLRNNGYLEKLSDLRTKTFDRELSVEEEEWANLKVRQSYIHY